MKTTTDTTAETSGFVTRLDSIRMGKEQRRQARASLREGELIAELVLRAVADIGAIARSVEHAAVILTSGIKAMWAKPVKH